MNEEDNVDARLTKIESKLDKIAELITQTQLQEYRLSVAEQDVKELKKEVSKIKAIPGNKAQMWVDTVTKFLITGVLSFIAVKVGLK